MVGGHELDRLAAEDADAVEFAAVEQHLGKARVVGRAAEHASEESVAGTQVSRARPDFFSGLGTIARDEIALGVPGVVGDETSFVGVIAVEARVVHAERIEEALAEEFIEVLAGQTGEEEREHIEVGTVVPTVAGMGVEGHVSDGEDHLLVAARRIVDQRVAGHESGALRGSYEQRIVGGRQFADGRQPRGHGHQVHDHNVAPGGLGVHGREGAAQSIVGRRLDRDEAVAELGEPAGNRVVEFEGAFLEQAHQDDCRDRLGLRVHAEEAVHAKRRVSLDVEAARCVGMDHLAVAQDHRDRAGEIASRDCFIDHVFDQCEAIGVEADGLRIGSGECVE